MERKQPQWNVLIRILLLIFIVLSTGQTFAQVKNRGTPHLINYPKKVYNAASQNWSITQDLRGFMYFGNNDGLLEFDGQQWRLYSLLNRFMYRAVYVSVDGTIYVGLTNDFGIMKPDENGRLSYQSIFEKFPNVSLNFNDIWKIYETADGIYFQAKNKIFLYHNNQLDVITPDKEFNFLHKVNKTLYTSERHRGLMLVSGTQALEAPGGDVFIGKNIETIIPYDDSNVIIGTAKDGLFFYNGKVAVPWAKEASEFLAENFIFCGTAINKKHFAFGTIRNGVLVLDKNGQPLQHINKAKGLQNNTVLSIYADRDDNLWVGLDQGISFIEINSPISFYGYGKSLPGTGYCTILSNGNIYAGTNQGLFRKKWSPYEDPLSQDDHFSLVPGTQGQVWSIKEIDNILFCGHNLGTFIIRNNEAEQISDIPGGWDYQLMRNYPDKLIGGTYTGLSVYSQTNQKWTLSHTLTGFSESTRFYAEDKDGSIWVAHGDLGIFRIVPDKTLTSASQVRVYNESDGLPSRYRNSVYKIDNQLLFTTISGIYRHNKTTDTFESDPLFANLIGKEPITSLIEDKEGNIWYFRPDEIGLIRTSSGGVKVVEKRPFNPLTRLINRGFEDVNVIDDENVFISCEEGFAHYDPSFPAKYPESRECFIRSLTGTGDSTRIFFGGVFTDKSGLAVVNQSDEHLIKIPFGYNNLRFEFSVPLFDDPENTLFSYILEGYDNGRSEWSPNAAKEYTGLHEGTYTFRVRGKSIFNIETADVLIKFRILPPWYRSALAIILYALVGLLLFGIAIRKIRMKIQRDKIHISEKHVQDINLARQLHIEESLESEKRLALLEKEKLEAEVVHKNKQLAISIAGLLKKNEFLIQVKDELEKIADKTSNPLVEDRLKKIMLSLNENLEADNDYEQFEDHFDAVHDNFLKTIKKQFPQLTPNDLRLCAYLRMNLSTKEIAPLLNISPRGVEISRYRLRKKMNLPHDANLIDFMLSI
jgi:ligand-binding sensor domain-containing protein/DNA-binding CsgD family transcriptional regulator